MCIAIYHLEAKAISRGAGRSAVAAAAYMSCSAIYNDYDGVQHDYTRKHGLVWQQVFLPEYAPVEWQDRGVLWNAVEDTEKTKDSRLAREFVAALPVEMDSGQWQSLLTEFIQENFVADGMCADVAIHDTDGHNPHAHIMLTVRPLNPDGTWQNKTEKEYLCVRNGEERGFTAAEFKSAKLDGWEKQYPYKVGKKKVYMPASAAEAKGYERASKYPKSTKYGRQNPISERWNSDEQLVRWREAWADTVNKHLERSGIDERIDHRSHAERGLDEQPTIHEGVAARALEEKGIVSERCELNRQIKADNILLRTLKSQLKKLMEAAKNTIPDIAEALETLRGNMLVLRYRLSQINGNFLSKGESLRTVKSARKQYISLVAEIKDKGKKRKELLSKKRDTPKIHFIRHKELTQQIAELTEELEELRSEKSRLLAKLQYAENDNSATFNRDIADMETSLKKLDEQEKKHSAWLDEALSEYNGIKEQAADFDPVELYEAKQAIRPEKEKSAEAQIQNIDGRFSIVTWLEAKKYVADILSEKSERYAMLHIQRQRHNEKQYTQRSKRRYQDWER